MVIQAPYRRLTDLLGKSCNEDDVALNRLINDY